MCPKLSANPVVRVRYSAARLRWSVWSCAGFVVCISLCCDCDCVWAFNTDCSDCAHVCFLLRPLVSWSNIADGFKFRGPTGCPLLAVPGAQFGSSKRFGRQDCTDLIFRMKLIAFRGGCSRQPLFPIRHSRYFLILWYHLFHEACGTLATVRVARGCQEGKGWCRTLPMQRLLPNQCFWMEVQCLPAHRFAGSCSVYICA